MSSRRNVPSQGFIHACTTPEREASFEGRPSLALALSRARTHASRACADAKAHYSHDGVYRCVDFQSPGRAARELTASTVEMALIDGGHMILIVPALWARGPGRIAIGRKNRVR